MAATTALSKVYRTPVAETLYRLNWLVFGGLVAVFLAFIPFIGWAMGLGLACVVLWKAFGFREVQTVGQCPACTKALRIDPKKDDVISCPVCAQVMQVQAERLVLINVSH